MHDLPLAIFSSGIGAFTIVRFLLHVLAIWLGTKATGIKEAGFIQLALVALVSYVVMFLAKLFLWPLGLFLFGLFGFLVSVIGVAVATKFMIDTDWGKAFSVGFIAAVVWIILSMVI